MSVLVSRYYCSFKCCVLNGSMIYNFKQCKRFAWTCNFLYHFTNWVCPSAERLDPPPAPPLLSILYMTKLVYI